MTISAAAARLLDDLWHDYIAIAPQAARIHALLGARGELVHHDHIALRTFACAELGCEALARPFEALGWRPRERYRFDARHLRARYWQHDDPDAPKIFISELIVSELSLAARAAIAGLIAQLPTGSGTRAGRPWQLAHATYEVLRAESEYAAWVAAFGPRVYRFTVDAGALITFPDLDAVVAYLVEHAFALDATEGVIHGSPRQRIEHASTRPDAIEVAFADRSARIRSSPYELVRRYRQASVRYAVSASR